MKFLIIGSDTGLEKDLCKELIKCGHEVARLLPDDLKHPETIGLVHTYYWKRLLFDDFFHSVQPTSVLFLFNQYESQHYMLMLKETLRCCLEYNVKEFLLLSSVSIYGNQEGIIDETFPLKPESSEGISCAEAEYSVNLVRSSFTSLIIARMANTLSDSFSPQNAQYRCWADSVTSQDTLRVSPHQKADALSDRDGARAIARLAESKISGIYNIASRKNVSLADVLQHMIRITGSGCRLIVDDTQSFSNICAQKLTDDTEWVQIDDPLEMILRPVQDEVETVSTKTGKRKPRSELRRTIEVLILGICFVLTAFLVSGSPIFAGFDWLMIYVVLAALFYGVRFATMSACLAAVSRLMLMGVDLFAANYFYLLAEGILVIVQYVVIGLMVSYTINLMKKKLKAREQKLGETRKELDELKLINSENVSVKRQYEEQILSSTTGYASLYHMFSSLIDLESTSEILEAAANLVLEQSGGLWCAVYELSAIGRPERCLASSGSVAKLKLVHRKQFMGCMNRKEIYIGDPFQDEPTYSLPLIGIEGLVGVFFVQDSESRQGSLAKMNDLMTTSSIISEFYKKAQKTEVEKRIHYTDSIYQFESKSKYESYLSSKSNDLYEDNYLNRQKDALENQSDRKQIIVPPILNPRILAAQNENSDDSAHSSRFNTVSSFGQMDSSSSDESGGGFA